MPHNIHMTGKDIFEYEIVRDSLLEKGRQLVKKKYPNRHSSSNHFPIFVEEGIKFHTHDGLYMMGTVLITWKELGL